MAEVIREVRTFEHRVYCNICDTELVMSAVLISNPSRYRYECPKCIGPTVIKDRLYPYYSYKEIT